MWKNIKYPSLQCLIEVAGNKKRKGKKGGTPHNPFGMNEKRKNE
jgi:hypothetical protein